VSCEAAQWPPLLNIRAAKQLVIIMIASSSEPRSGSGISFSGLAKGMLLVAHLGALAAIEPLRGSVQLITS